MPGQYTEFAIEAALERCLTTASGSVTARRDGFEPHRVIVPAATYGEFV
jgi:hypothetical protein